MLAWIPAMTVLSMFFVGIPAVAVERVGPLAALSRSLELTRGHRWRIFRFYFMPLLVTFVIYFQMCTVQENDPMTSIAEFVDRIEQRSRPTTTDSDSL